MGVLTHVRGFTVPGELEAHGPAELDGGARHDARMLVANRGSGELRHGVASDLPDRLRPGDLLVVNISQTVPAALESDHGQILHLGTPLPDGRWVVEPRTPFGAGTHPLTLDRPARWAFPEGAAVELLEPHGPDSPLWLAAIDLGDDPLGYLGRHGQPVRYGYVSEAWPLSAYRTDVGRVPGSAEMPSAARPLTPRLLRRLRRRGVEIRPILLHTGLSTANPPLPERFAVTPATADAVTRARREHRRVIAVGTTAVRALETVWDGDRAHPDQGWTDTLITPARPPRSVDGLLSGWHEPDASHLDLLQAVGGVDLVTASYDAALAAGYRWHEFGDVHLILP